MDPQETLKCIRELTREILDHPVVYTALQPKSADLAALVDMLDEWLMHGGALPMDWHIAQQLKLRYAPRAPYPEGNRRPWLPR
jgi:hypothetical protein